MRKKIIFADPGHGGDDNGAVYKDKLGYVEEDDTNLIIGFLLRYELLLAGNYEVYMSRQRDVGVDLSERTKVANALDADIFVSIHCDAFEDTSVQGMTVHVHPHCSKQSEILAECLSNQLKFAFPTHRNRGVKKSDFSVLRKSKMPAILIECEFVSNPKTRRFLKEPENQLVLAQAIMAGIEAYFSKGE